MEYLIMIVNGFLVALGTAAVLGSKKASALPGGSLGAGIFFAIWVHKNCLVGAVLGIFGWLVFVLVARRITNHWTRRDRERP